MPGSSPVKLDRSTVSVVAVCACGWRAVAGRADPVAHRAAVHLEAVHRDYVRAHDLRRRNENGRAS